MLRFDDLSLRRGTKLLFADMTLQIPPGRRVGLIGANGCGKSSLVALVAGRLQADHGDCRYPRDWVLAEVAQEIPDSDRPAIEFVIDGDAELRRTEAEIAAATENALAELLTHLEQIGGYQAESRAARLMHGLGFDDTELRRPVNEFSGGWRMRLNLARALMCRSDLLLLDEPTNHLDLDAVIWLESWLCAYPGTLLMISHDRDFLDRVCQQIVQIEAQKVNTYTGNYSAFERIRAEHLARQQAEYEKQQREVTHMRQFVDRFRAKATKARQAQSRLKALERMVTIAPAHVDSPFHFGFRAPAHNPTPLLGLEQVSVGYDATPILQHVDLVLTPGDRIGLLGRNGAGKTTLIKLIAGELDPIAGSRSTARHLSIGYFAQHQVERLHPAHSALEHLQQLDPKASEQSLRDYLGGFGFAGDIAVAPVAPFSGGEKSRLALALLVYRRPNLLLLDEPTNHLDIEMRQALATALQTFEGAMLIVSHDRHLLRVCCDRLLLVDNRGVDDFGESLDDYPRWLAKGGSGDGGDTKPAVTTNDSNMASRRDERRNAAALRQQLAPLKQAVTRLENQLERLHRRQHELAQQLADPDLYDTARKDELMALLQQKARTDNEAEQLETAWLEAQEALDSAQADQP